MTVEQVLRLAVDAQLLTSDEAQQWSAWWEEQSGSPEDGAGLIAALREEQVISEFHAQAIRNNVAGPYKLGPYRVYDRLAVGRLGSIYRAEHEEFRQPVGLKVFSSDLQQDPERAMRLARETRIAVQVDHPHVVRTYQVGRIGNVTFLAIEDLQGWTLAEQLAQDGKLDPIVTCRLMREVALGLEHLHSLDIVHRDVQPANIWLMSDGHTKLMEFGAARDALADVLDRDEYNVPLLSDELLGSYDYMSSLQAADEHAVDRRSDIYSLGCVFYRCLTGEVVFPDSNPVRKMARHAHEPAPLASEVNPDVPREISDVVAMMLAKDPDQRYQTAADAAWAIEQIIDLEEKELAVAAEVSEEFLRWARESQIADDREEIPVVVAEPEFLGFAKWLSEVEAEEEQANRKS